MLIIYKMVIPRSSNDRGGSKDRDATEFRQAGREVTTLMSPLPTRDQWNCWFRPASGEIGGVTNSFQLDVSETGVGYFGDNRRKHR